MVSLIRLGVRERD